MKQGAAIAATLALALGALGACRSKPAPADPLVKRAQFGIFFGGQVQERREVPFEVDRAKQLSGFRIDFARPLRHAHQVKWEISMPGGGRSRGRLVHVDQQEVHAGQKRLDHPMPFKPGDPLGVWNLRVMVDQTIVIDRMFRVYDAARRARQRAQHDGGA